ncbi:hypothetical protein Ahy_B01g051851 [Arachis hypogaea]|uniref:Uncharacterized protein n=1 Tax=Arachis hypogaea TaxID=3818 RepID=A0A445AMW6_ARAHY|nr:hypothetical protein Ahy_B01g051851 [Arachis hypogaea]
MLSDIRQWCDHLTPWIRPSLKTELEVHFRNDDGFKHCRLTNIVNRTSPRSSKYTGASATFMKTKIRLSKSLDCEATLVEIFKYTHTLKANKGRFADERSGVHYDDYTQRLEAAIQQSQPPSGNDEYDSETSVSEQRHNDLLARIGGAVAINSDPTEKLEQLDHLREQMEVYNQQMRAGGSGTAGTSGNTVGGAPPSASTPPPQQGEDDNDDYLNL